MIMVIFHSYVKLPEGIWKYISKIMRDEDLRGGVVLPIESEKLGLS